MNVLDLISQYVTLTKASSSSEEFCGPCVFCGTGTDRMRVWPQSGAEGRYWCRQCNRKGDAIQFLRDYHGLSFHEAKQRVRGNHAPKDYPRPSLGRALEAEFKAWKSEKYLDACARILETQSVIESLIACRRFSLSEKETETLERTLTEWCDRLDATESDLVRYSPNPKVDDALARQEWESTFSDY